MTAPPPPRPTPHRQVPLLGAIINKVPQHDHAIMAMQLRRRFEEGKIPLLGVLPDVRGARGTELDGRCALLRCVVLSTGCGALCGAAPCRAAMWRGLHCTLRSARACPCAHKGAIWLAGALEAALRGGQDPAAGRAARREPGSAGSVLRCAARCWLGCAALSCAAPCLARDVLCCAWCVCSH